MPENVAFQDIFTSVKMQRVLEIAFVPQDFLWKTFFKETNKSNSEYVQIDKYKHSRKLATFVSPLLEGRLVEKRGFFSDVLKPPYIKEMKVTQAYNLLRRPMGQNPYMPIKSPRAVAMEELGRDTAELKDRVFRRIEAMCAEVMLTGQLVVQGDGIDFAYDYQMPADNQWTVANTKIPTAWSVSTADILTDIEEAGDLVRQNTGRVANMTILGRNLFKHFRSNEDIRAILDNRNFESGKFRNTVLPKGIHYVGNIAEMDFFVYVEYYEDDAGNLINVFDPDKAIVTSTDLRASTEYGAIQDLEFPVDIPAEWFLKTWMQKNPSVQPLLIQSSPLPVHHQMEGVVVLRPLT